MCVWVYKTTSSFTAGELTSPDHPCMVDAPPTGVDEAWFDQIAACTMGGFVSTPAFFLGRCGSLIVSIGGQEYQNTFHAPAGSISRLTAICCVTLQLMALHEYTTLRLVET